MRIASADAPKRPDSIEFAVGLSVQFGADRKPSINWRHVDGPLLFMRNGQFHWLTLWERFQCWLGKADAISLERKYSPDFMRRWAAQENMQRNVDYWGERCCRAEAQNRRLREALEMMVSEKAGYMTINHLGDPEAQHTIKAARAALTASERQK